MPQDELFYKQTTEPYLVGDPSPLPKQVGPYKIQALLHRGGMSTLYLGSHQETGHIHALKVLTKDLLQQEEAVSHFLQETKTIALANHPNIVKLHEEGTWEGGLYLAMEWIHGISLRTLLKKNPPSLKKAIQLILQITKALGHLHSLGIVHRDLKLDNILLTQQGQIKIVDFGISRLIEQVQSGSYSWISGTPSYMSPEQKEHPEEASFASDIYSLGVVAYELILGCPCYGFIQLASLPNHLEQILQKALAFSPGARYTSTKALDDVLANYLNSEKIEIEKPKKDERKELLELIEESYFSLVPPIESLKEFPYIGLQQFINPSEFSLYYDVIILSDQSILLVIAEAEKTQTIPFLSLASLKGAISTLIAAWKPDEEALLPFLLRFLHFSSFSLLHLLPASQRICFASRNYSGLLCLHSGEHLFPSSSEEVLERSWTLEDLFVLHSPTGIEHPMQLSSIPAQLLADTFLKEYEQKESSNKKSYVLFVIQSPTFSDF